MLQKPIFKEPDNRYVKAVLDNNIAIRIQRTQVAAIQATTKEIWNHLDQLEKDILVILTAHSGASTKDLVKLTKRSAPTIHKRINHLLNLNIIDAKGSSLRDPQRAFFLKSVISNA